MDERTETLEVRSFRACFRLERRIFKIDRWRLPVPFGVPLRGIGYAVLSLLTVLILSRLPMLGALHPALRLVVLPIGAAYALTRWEVDGRPAHASGRSWVRMRLLPPRIAAFRPAPSPGTVVLGPVTVAPDERAARLRPAIIEGPATVLVRYPFRAEPRGRTLRVRPEAGPPQWRGKEIRLGEGQRVVIG
jgi:hypothetical protein